VGVRLSFKPSGNVTVFVSSLDTTVATPTSASLTFTPSNYATQQTLTVNGVEDADTLNDTTSLSFTATGATSKTLGVSVIDND
jgi:hypothetical protein